MSNQPKTPDPMTKYKLNNETKPTGNQDAFNRVWERLVDHNDWGVCMDEYTCLYRDDKGNACAIGYMMPDNLILEGFRPKSPGISHLIVMSRDVAEWFSNCDPDLLVHLQNAHDVCGKQGAEYLAAHLERIAHMHNLTAPATPKPLTL